MAEWIRAALDIVLIGLVAAGLVQAARLMRHLSGLQQGRLDMEKFVRDFSATVFRAETGIKTLKQAARDTGDDLEKLVDKARNIRDELQFLVESADQIAERLSQSASVAVKPEDRRTATAPGQKTPSAATAPVKADLEPLDPAPAPAAVPPASRAEKELLQALRKLS